MIYFLLFLHFGFNFFVIMCFAAFVYASTQSKFFEKLSILYLSIYSILELAVVSFLLINGHKSAVWFIWLASVFIVCLISITFYFCRKLDITMWGPFSIIFGPLIIIPVFAFLPIIKKAGKRVSDNSEQ